MTTINETLIENVLENPAQIDKAIYVLQLLKLTALYERLVAEGYEVRSLTVLGKNDFIVSDEDVIEFHVRAVREPDEVKQDVKEDQNDTNNSSVQSE